MARSNDLTLVDAIRAVSEEAANEPELTATVVSITARECPVIIGNTAQLITGNAAHFNGRPSSPTSR